MENPMPAAAALILLFLLLAFLVWIGPQIRTALLSVCRRWDRYRFETRVELLGKADGPQEIDVFALSMRGRILAPYENCDTDVQVEILDTTDGTARPLRILCTAPQMQKSPSAEFLFQTHNGLIPGRNAILMRWRTVMELECNVLRFPRRGQRRLLFITRIHQKNSERKLACAKTVLNYFVTVKEGYLDFQEQMENILTAGWTLAQLAADHPPKPSQQYLLEQWLHQSTTHLSLSPDVDLEPFPGDVSKASQKACDILLNQSDAAFRYELMELCLRIAEADKPVKRSTQDWLRKLAAALEIAPDRFREMYQKHLPLDAHEDPDPAFVLGIDETLSPDQLAERLTEEYQKWNGRVNHPDPAVRKRADEMLSYLTSIRNQMQLSTR
jgi:hypothetical protein